MVDTVVAYEGWSPALVGWGEQGWGASESPDFYATGAVGTVDVLQNTVVLPTSVFATTFLGLESVTCDAVFGITGFSATTDLGNVTAFAGSGAAVTGEVATTALGTVTQTTEAIFPVTGAEILAYLGVVSSSGDSIAAVTGESATGAIGSLVVPIDVLIPMSGWEPVNVGWGDGGWGTASSSTSGTTSVGTVSVTVEVSVDVAVTAFEAVAGLGLAGVEAGGGSEFPVSGVIAVGEVGTLSYSLDNAFSVTGNEATTELNSLINSTDVLVAFGGWSIVGWGEQGWGQDGAFAAIPTYLGTVQVTAGQEIAITSFGATSAIGNVGFASDGVFSVTGTAATGAIGSTGLSGDVLVTFSGWNTSEWGYGGWGTATIDISAAASLGTVTNVATALVTPTGVVATASTNTPNIRTDTAPYAESYSVSAVLGLIDVSVDGNVIIIPTGVFATTEINGIIEDVTTEVVGVAGEAVTDPRIEICVQSITEWSAINETQNPSWSQIAA